MRHIKRRYFIHIPYDSTLDYFLTDSTLLYFCTFNLAPLLLIRTTSHLELRGKNSRLKPIFSAGIGKNRGIIMKKAQLKTTLLTGVVAAAALGVSSLVSAVPTFTASYDGNACVAITCAALGSTMTGVSGELSLLQQPAYQGQQNAQVTIPAMAPQSFLTT